MTAPTITEQRAWMGDLPARIEADWGCWYPVSRDLDMLRAVLATLEAQPAMLAVIEAARRHIRSFEPGTLIGSELNLANCLADLDGDVWAPWLVPPAPEETNNG